MIVTQVSNIKLLILAKYTIQFIFLLVDGSKAQIKRHGENDDASGEPTANGTPFDVVWSGGKYCQRQATHEFSKPKPRRGVANLRIRLGKHGGAEKRAALPEDCKNGEASATLGVRAVIVQQPSDLDSISQSNVVPILLVKGRKHSRLCTRPGKCHRLPAICRSSGRQLSSSHRQWLG